MFSGYWYEVLLSEIGNVDYQAGLFGVDLGKSMFRARLAIHFCSFWLSDVW